MKRIALMIVMAGIGAASTTSAVAETLRRPSFQLELPVGWEHSIENRPGDGSGEVIGINHPNSIGSVKMLSYPAPAVVSRELLRNLTNVDSSTPLRWQSWGDFSGYHHEYIERGKFYRHWWLASGVDIVIVSYQCDPDSRKIETEAIDAIVRSLRVTPDRSE